MRPASSPSAPRRPAGLSVRPVTATVRRIVLLGAILLFGARAWADSSVTEQRSVHQIGRDLYVIRHPDAPDTFPQGNTTVVIGSRGVLVVDSCYRPTAAQQDIEQIRAWTRLPVLYLVNTHWHPDNVRGNYTYAAAFPGLTIIAHRATAKLLELYEPDNMRRREERRVQYAQQIADAARGRTPRMKPKDLEDLRGTLAGIEATAAEFAAPYTITAPNLVFDSELEIDLGGRRAIIRHTGPGDTLGDTVVLLPDDGTLVAGDAVVHPVPYFYSSYPRELARELGELDQIDFKTLVPGHGDIQTDHTYLRNVKALIEDVVARVDAEVAREGSLSARLETVRKTIDVSRYRASFAGSDAGSQEYFDSSIEGLIADAFHQTMK